MAWKDIDAKLDKAADCDALWLRLPLRVLCAAALHHARALHGAWAVPT